MLNRKPDPERRDTSPEGVAGRNRFEQSLVLLRALGLSPDAIEYYRRRAGETGRLPHELVRDLAEDTSMRPDKKIPGPSPRR